MQSAKRDEEKPGNQTSRQSDLAGWRACPRRCCCSTAPACGSARYFGVPSSITAPDGRPVNAVRGFLDSVATLITKHRPGRLVVCLDLDWRPQFRVDRIPSYKAHRVEEENPSRASRCRGSSGRFVAAGRDDRGDTRRVRLLQRRRRGFRGRRRDRHAGRSGATRPGHRRQRRPRPAAGRPRRPGPGAGALPRTRPEQRHADGSRRGRRANTACPSTGPASATPSWRCSAATPPTGCPGCLASARRPPPRCWRSTARWPRSWTPSTTPTSSLAKGVRAKLRNAADYIEAAGPVVRVATDAPVTLSTDTDAVPLVAADPTRTAELATRTRRRVADRAVAEGSRRAARVVNYLGRPTS